MYVIKVLSSFKKSFSTNLTFSSLKRIQRYSDKPKQTTSFSKNIVEKDVVLFSFEKPKFFLSIYILSAAQFGFWLYAGGVLFHVLKDPSLKVNSESFWGKIIDKEREYSKILKPVSFLMVFAAFSGSWLYSSRNIRTIMLHKGGREVTLVTYGLPGFNTFSVPLSKISSLQPRSKAKRYIPLKIKNKPFHFLLDITGKFSDPLLFDYTVGIKRAL